MKKKEIETYKPKIMNVIIYDSDNICYYNGVITYFDKKTNVDSGYYLSGETYNNIMSYSVHIEVPNLEMLDNITLDDTTMKRIAKYNKQQECRRLDKEIENKKEKLKELDDLLQDKEKRWNKVKDYIKNIYDINCDDDDDDNEYYDY